MKQSWFAIVFVGLTFAISVSPAIGDVSPPMQGASSGVAPAGVTKVQMVSERVEFDLRDLYSEATYVEFGGSIPVSAEFVMVNRGLASERMQVQFPLDLGSTLTNEPFSSIQDLSVLIDGSSVVTHTVQTERVGCRSEDCSPISWAAFDVVFPPSQPVFIRVEYHATANKYGSRANFTYLLETGAGWYGPIGQAIILARLPYMAEPLNVAGRWTLDPTVEYRYNEARWYAQNFEPTPQSNVSIDVVYTDIGRLSWQHGPN